jgi:hypothetical protein
VSDAKLNSASNGNIFHRGHRAKPTDFTENTTFFNGSKSDFSLILVLTGEVGLYSKSSSDPESTELFSLGRGESYRATAKSKTRLWYLHMNRIDFGSKKKTKKLFCYI